MRKGPTESTAQAVELIEKEQPTLVILDVMMPQMDGLEVCRTLRSTGDDRPILLLTARDGVSDRVAGLDAGADDYLPKPFALEELLARVRSLFRRSITESQAPEQPKELEFEDLVLNPDTRDVTRGGKPISLTRTEFALLEYLMRNSGRVLTRGQLIDRVWGSDYVGDTKTLDVHVKRLRSKIETDPGKPVHLVTVRGLGYKFES